MPSTQRPAHPRSRGENNIEAIADQAYIGSSPLTRGKPLFDDGVRDRERLIPAHAGKTRSRKLEQLSARAHPRSRGENNIEAIADQAYIGSSPLTRGKPLFDDGVRDRERLIPAHAGKTWMRARTRSCDAAHPRSRGENVIDELHEINTKGSSPLTRGKHPADIEAMYRTGLIPAHAGKTGSSVCYGCTTPAHPRSRGENGAKSRYSASGRGSSPLTRGKRHHAHEVRQRGRLIPAHAGKTQEFNQAILDLGAHPRSRGENWKLTWRQPPRRGSSPLTRGKLAGTAIHEERVGLIPAHAGKTPWEAYTLK